MTEQEATKSLHLPYLFILLAIKLLVHLMAIFKDYGLHRDEYLYLAEGDHLLWGYMEGPPIIGWIAGLSKSLMGSSIWAAKLPVLLIGLLSIWLILELVKEMGGGKNAQLIAGMGWLFSPIFLGANHLFQPVSFNQFCWLLIGLAWVRVINHQRNKDWYLLGLAVGIGLLTKYSIGVYLAGLSVGILLSPYRKWLLKPQAWIAVGIAWLLFLPNLFWQIHYNFPLLGHMRELASTQLVNMTVGDFLIPQFLFHFAGTLI
ncbi:MAG: glycosyltransferase family 39 protein, partial [Bacteroidota bacterium]